jgi:hypothetical protein
MLSDKYKKILLLVFLASCTSSGYKPSYIITDQPLSEEAKTGNKKLKEPLSDPIR